MQDSHFMYEENILVRTYLV